MDGECSSDSCVCDNRIFLTLENEMVHSNNRQSSAQRRILTRVRIGTRSGCLGLLGAGPRFGTTSSPASLRLEAASLSGDVVWDIAQGINLRMMVPIHTEMRHVAP